MLVFGDEAGDSGLKLAQGSSKFFTVALVIFEEHDEAIACDQRIELLKKELGWSSGSEFHFRNNSDRVRRKFLNAVAPYNFFYYGIVFNKDPSMLASDIFVDKKGFYKYACSLVFENAKDKLTEAIVTIDQSGSTDFRSELAKYLRRKMNEEGKRELIKKVKMQRSSSNNLLQLADYIAGIINRGVQKEKRYAEDYKRLIAHREISVEVYPK
jgi:Protein of unknown function (DUF3800)